MNTINVVLNVTHDLAAPMCVKASTPANPAAHCRMHPASCAIAPLPVPVFFLKKYHPKYLQQVDYDKS